MAQYKTRDPQNPYKTGVLVGNYVEDKFGAQAAATEVSYIQIIYSTKLNKKSLPLSFKAIGKL